MKTKYIDKEISMLERMEQLEVISQQGLDTLKEFKYLRDLAKGQLLPIDSVVGQGKQLKCSGCNKPLHNGLCGGCCSDLLSGNY